MDIPEGFKQTEVGVIPSDWVTNQFIGIVEKYIDYRGRTPKKIGMDWGNGNIPALSANNVQMGKIDLSKESNFGSLELHNKWMTQGKTEKGDILLTMEAPLGNVAQIPDDNKYILSQRVLLIKPIEEIDKNFLAWFLTANFFQSELNKYSSGSTAKGIQRKKLNEILIYFPPEKAEQTAIATALNDTDLLITQLEQLIAKKRNIKQWAMQQFFLPKDSYNIRMLCEVSSLKGRIGWQGLKQTEFTTNQDEPFLITGMNFKDGAIRWNEVYHIPEERYEVAKEIQLKVDDVLMTKDGTIGKMLYIDNIPHPGKATLNSHLLLFRPIRESYFPKYLYYQLTSKRFLDFVELNKSGTTFFGLSQSAVGKYPMLLPSIEEQTQIAQILTDMDTGLEALEQKLAKYRMLKQGMMQTLLTGKTRLVKPNPS